MYAMFYDISLISGNYNLKILGNFALHVGSKLSSLFSCITLE